MKQKIKKSNIGRKKRNVKNIIGWGVIAITFCLFLYVSTKRTIENTRLQRNGRCTYAVVVSKQRVGSKGTIRVSYRFSHNGRFYYGRSHHDDRAEIGSYIVVVFLESAPQVNRSNSFLEKECNTMVNDSNTPAAQLPPNSEKEINQAPIVSQP